jgi:hypothetical protein
MKSGSTIYNKQIFAIFYTAYIISTIQVLLASSLALNFTDPLAIVGYVMSLPIVPLSLFMYYNSRQEDMSFLEYVNYTMNMRRF